MDIQQQKYYKIDLIGDSCEDIYHYGICERLSPEAPVPVLKEHTTKILKGMSWNVRLNLETFGAFVLHYTNSEKIKKHRFIDKRYNQHLLRWDEGEQEKLEPFVVKKIMYAEQPNAVVISDYNKGFLPPKVCCEIIEYYNSLNSEIPIFVDSKKTDLSCFENCYIKINEKEFNNIEKFPKNCKFIVTLGERGTLYDGTVYPTNAVEVFDVCGAGDVFLSTLSYMYAVNNDIIAAIKAANKMASLSVTHMGTYVLTKDDIGIINK